MLYSKNLNKLLAIKYLDKYQVSSFVPILARRNFINTDSNQCKPAAPMKS